MYKAIRYFVDLQDNGHGYNIDDPFPREGLEVTPERLEQLASCNNRRKTPLIALVEEVPEKKETPTKAKRARKSAE